jgi:hypothetical protein
MPVDQKGLMPKHVLGANIQAGIQKNIAERQENRAGATGERIFISGFAHTASLDEKKWTVQLLPDLDGPLNGGKAGARASIVIQVTGDRTIFFNIRSLQPAA